MHPRKCGILLLRHRMNASKSGQVLMHIFSYETLRKAAEAIVCLEPDAFTGAVTFDQVMVALGEHLDVWPSCIFDDIDDEEKLAA